MNDIIVTYLIGILSGVILCLFLFVIRIWMRATMREMVWKVADERDEIKEKIMSRDDGKLSERNG